MLKETEALTLPWSDAGPEKGRVHVNNQLETDKLPESMRLTKEDVRDVEASKVVDLNEKNNDILKNKISPEKLEKGG